MPIDHSKATIALFLDGLALFCFHGREFCDLGIVNHEHHSFSVDVFKISPQGIKPIEHDLAYDRDILIEAVRPVFPGIRPYDPGTFNRSVHDDPEDFRWVVNLENDEFHDKPLTVYNAELLTPRIRISNGLFYTADKSRRDLMRENWGSSYDPEVDFGRMSNFLGVDIELSEGGELVLSNGAANRLILKKEADTRYAISLKNTPTPHMHHHARTLRPGSHFRLYYNVVSDPTGDKYDLFVPVQQGIEGRYPVVCDLAFLGLKEGLP